jgi:hypothetical protein
MYKALRCTCKMLGTVPSTGAMVSAQRTMAHGVDELGRWKRTVGTMEGMTGFLVGMLGLALVASSGTALATTACNEAISGVVVDGVVVNPGPPCVLDGAHVSGGVHVNQGGVLIACASTINGGIVANGALTVFIGGGEDEPADCPGNTVSGGIQISDTGPSAIPLAPSIALERSAIHGDVHLTGNQGRIVVASDIIAGGLFCLHNSEFFLDNKSKPSEITGAVRCEFE